MRIVLPAVRYGLPVLLTVAGVYFLESDAETWGGLGVMLIGTAVIVLMLNVMFRISLRSNRERSEEERARDYYAKHGHWPDERG